MRNHVDVHDNDIQGKDEIANSHEWHKDTAHMGNAPNAAKSDKQGYRRNKASHEQRIEAESLVQGPTDSVTLDGVIGEAEGERDEHRK